MTQWTVRKMSGNIGAVLTGARVADSGTKELDAVRSEADQPGKRSAGSQSWAGVCNTHYWIDPAKDVCAVIMTQSLPFVEPRFLQTYDAYERAVYAEAG